MPGNLAYAPLRMRRTSRGCERHRAGCLESSRLFELYAGSLRVVRGAHRVLPRISALVDEDAGYPVAVASSVPFACSGPEDLPPEGWDWVVETARSEEGAGQYPWRLGGFSACRSPNQELCPGHDPIAGRSGRGQEARRRGGAVRPSAKVQHPWVPIADYIRWTDEDGRPYDP